MKSLTLVAALLCATTASAQTPPPPPPAYTTQDITLYVSPAGNDRNSGSQQFPLLTCAGARQRIPANVLHHVDVYFAPGSYLPPVGAPNIQANCDATGINVIQSGPYADGAYVTFHGAPAAKVETLADGGGIPVYSGIGNDGGEYGGSVFAAVDVNPDGGSGILFPTDGGLIGDFVQFVGGPSDPCDFTSFGTYYGVVTANTGSQIGMVGLYCTPTTASKFVAVTPSSVLTAGTSFFGPMILAGTSSGVSFDNFTLWGQEAAVEVQTGGFVTINTSRLLTTYGPLATVSGGKLVLFNDEIQVPAGSRDTGVYVTNNGAAAIENSVISGGSFSSGNSAVLSTQDSQITVGDSYLSGFWCGNVTSVSYMEWDSSYCLAAQAAIVATGNSHALMVAISGTTNNGSAGFGLAVSRQGSTIDINPNNNTTFLATLYFADGGTTLPDGGTVIGSVNFGVSTFSAAQLAAGPQIGPDNGAVTAIGF